MFGAVDLSGKAAAVPHPAAVRQAHAQRDTAFAAAFDHDFADTALDVPVTTQLDAANAQPGLAADEADNSVEFAHNTAAPSATTAGATAELPAAAPDAAGAAVTLPDTGKL